MAERGGHYMGRESGSFTRGVRVLTLRRDQQSVLSEEGAPTLYHRDKWLAWLHPGSAWERLGAWGQGRMAASNSSWRCACRLPWYKI
jgi:hypothetical protein